jgi:two-component system LytT family response regulator
LRSNVQTVSDSRPETNGFSARLAFRDSGRIIGVEVQEIDWIEAAGNYVQIYTPRRTHLVRHTLKALLAKLDPAQFVRVRPSAIVQVDRLARLAHRPGGEYVLTLRDGTQIPSSRSFRTEVERAFGRAAPDALRSGS